MAAPRPDGDGSPQQVGVAMKLIDAAIARREQGVFQLHLWCSGATKHTQLVSRDALLRLAGDVRRLSIIIVEAVQMWRAALVASDPFGGSLVPLIDSNAAQATLASAAAGPAFAPYIWQGHNYLRKMLHDCDFISESPEALTFLALTPATARFNPLFAPSSLASPLKAPVIPWVTDYMLRRAIAADHRELVGASLVQDTVVAEGAKAADTSGPRSPGSPSKARSRTGVGGRPATRGGRAATAAPPPMTVSTLTPIVADASPETASMHISLAMSNKRVVDAHAAAVSGLGPDDILESDVLLLAQHAHVQALVDRVRLVRAHVLLTEESARDVRIAESRAVAGVISGSIAAAASGRSGTPGSAASGPSPAPLLVASSSPVKLAGQLSLTGGLSSGLSSGFSSAGARSLASTPPDMPRVLSPNTTGGSGSGSGSGAAASTPSALQEIAAASVRAAFAGVGSASASASAGSSATTSPGTAAPAFTVPKPYDPALTSRVGSIYPSAGPVPSGTLLPSPDGSMQPATSPLRGELLFSGNPSAAAESFLQKIGALRSSILASVNGLGPPGGGGGDSVSAAAAMGKLLAQQQIAVPQLRTAAEIRGDTPSGGMSASQRAAEDALALTAGIAGTLSEALPRHYGTGGGGGGGGSGGTPFSLPSIATGRQSPATIIQSLQQQTPTPGGGGGGGGPGGSGGLLSYTTGGPFRQGPPHGLGPGLLSGMGSGPHTGSLLQQQQAPVQGALLTHHAQQQQQMLQHQHQQYGPHSSSETAAQHGLLHHTASTGTTQHHSAYPIASPSRPGGVGSSGGGSAFTSPSRGAGNGNGNGNGGSMSPVRSPATRELWGKQFKAPVKGAAAAPHAAPAQQPLAAKASAKAARLQQLEAQVMELHHKLHHQEQELAKLHAFQTITRKQDFALSTGVSLPASANPVAQMDAAQLSALRKMTRMGTGKSASKHGGAGGRASSASSDLASLTLPLPLPPPKSRGGSAMDRDMYFQGPVEGSDWASSSSRLPALPGQYRPPATTTGVGSSTTRLQRGPTQQRVQSGGIIRSSAIAAARQAARLESRGSLYSPSPPPTRGRDSLASPGSAFKSPSRSIMGSPSARSRATATPSRGASATGTPSRGVATPVRRGLASPSPQPQQQQQQRTPASNKRVDDKPWRSPPAPLPPNWTPGSNSKTRAAANAKAGGAASKGRAGATPVRGRGGMPPLSPMPRGAVKGAAAAPGSTQRGRTTQPAAAAAAAASHTTPTRAGKTAILTPSPQSTARATPAASSPATGTGGDPAGLFFVSPTTPLRDISDVADVADVADADADAMHMEPPSPARTPVLRSPAILPTHSRRSSVGSVQSRGSGGASPDVPAAAAAKLAAAGGSLGTPASLHRRVSRNGNLELSVLEAGAPSSNVKAAPYTPGARRGGGGAAGPGGAGAGSMRKLELIPLTPAGPTTAPDTAAAAAHDDASAPAHVDVEVTPVTGYETQPEQSPPMLASRPGSRREGTRGGGSASGSGSGNTSGRSSASGSAHSSRGRTPAASRPASSHSHSHSHSSAAAVAAAVPEELELGLSAPFPDAPTAHASVPPQEAAVGLTVETGVSSHTSSSSSSSSSSAAASAPHEDHAIRALSTITEAAAESVTPDAAAAATPASLAPHTVVHAASSEMSPMAHSHSAVAPAEVAVATHAAPESHQPSAPEAGPSDHPAATEPPAEAAVPQPEVHAAAVASA